MQAMAMDTIRNVQIRIGFFYFELDSEKPLAMGFMIGVNGVNK